jgi:NADPH-dependent 2,4-dienoyl-CoA reductase/sulfur reductase-like enzyme
MKECELIVIGGGSAGLAAAISAYDNGLKDILIIEKNEELGGILNQCIHNGFGLEMFKEELTGPEYAYHYIEEVKKRGITYRLNSLVTSISKEKVVTYLNSNEGLISIKAKAIVYSAGCSERSAGQIYLPGFRPKGIYTAGLAQKYLNIDGYLVGKRAYILGSGDIGLIMARRMTLEGAKVLGVSEIMPYSNGLNRNIVQCLNDFSIPLRLHNTVTKVYGRYKLEGIDISDVDSSFKPIPSSTQHISCDTLLLSVGLYPYNTLLNNAGASSYVKTKGAFVNQFLETSIPGVFSCGNVLQVHDLVDKVSKEGTLAGKNAADYIFSKRGKLIKRLFTNASDNLSYLLPNIVEVYSDTSEVRFSFRVKKPIKKGNIIFYDSDKIIYNVTKNFLAPSEMVTISLKDINFASYEEIDVKVEEVE